MPQCWKYSQICCDVALAGIELGNWTCELCQESCILHSDYPLNRVNQTLYFVIFLSFVHRILTHANEEYETLMALQTSWRLQRKTRHASTLFSNLPPERKFRNWSQKMINILYRLCIFSRNIWQWLSVWEKKNTRFFIQRKDKRDDQCIILAYAIRKIIHVHIVRNRPYRHTTIQLVLQK